MKIPLSWLKDFVEIDLPLEELARLLTLAGLEVEEIHYVGLPMRRGGEKRQETKITGIEWDPEKIIVGAIYEVMPHPNADRLVLCKLDDGEQVHIVLTGAPNLFPYKGQGPLLAPIKVAYAREGAQLYDGHQSGQVLMTLKRTKIRGVDSYSMACSEKELGISDDHEGIILLDADAPLGMPLVDYMGDAVLDIAIIPNIARDANILGVAREIAALTGKPLRKPDLNIPIQGPPIEGRVHLEIKEPNLNPRFVLGLVENIAIRPSPYEAQRRLRLAGMRPINNIVDATNYAMLELGEPLHAFDYDVLIQRAGGGTPTILTRRANQGEHLKTLDGVEHILDDFTVLVCDTAGPLSIAGVMGGEESEVSDKTINILLEGAAWNFTNIRRTTSAQHMSSEAAYRFSRGVHPSLAEVGVLRGLQLMQQWSGGTVSEGLVDEYPLPPIDPTVQFTAMDVQRWLGIEIPMNEIAEILRRLEFKVNVDEATITATTPDHRLDIGSGVVGVADLMEEIARIYGYERIPEKRLADELPVQLGNREIELETRLKDILVNLGLQEVVSYRMTSPEREARLLPKHTRAGLETNPIAPRPYVRLANPVASDRSVMRQSLLASIMEVAERNARLQSRLTLFEVGNVFLSQEDDILPDEPRRLAILLTGQRDLPCWQGVDKHLMDFYDMKGILEALLAGLHLPPAHYSPAEHPSLHPGKTSIVEIGEKVIGIFGEIHPLLHENFELPATPVILAEIDLEPIFAMQVTHDEVHPVPVFPPVLEDLAFVVNEAIPAERIVEAIKQAGGSILTQVRLFDVYRGGQAGEGYKSLAYNLTFQAEDRTLTDLEVAQIRQRIIQRLQKELGARLRS